MDLSELVWHRHVSSKLENYPNNESAEIPRTQRRGDRMSAVLLKKIWKHAQWVSVLPQWSNCNKSRLTSLDLKANLARLRDEWQENGRSTEFMDSLQSEWSDSKSALHQTDSQTRPPPTQVRGRRDEVEPNTADLRLNQDLCEQWACISTKLTPVLKKYIGLIIDRIIPQYVNVWWMTM